MGFKYGWRACSTVARSQATYSAHCCSARCGSEVTLWSSARSLAAVRCAKRCMQHVQSSLYRCSACTRELEHVRGCLRAYVGACVDACVGVHTYVSRQSERRCLTAHDVVESDLLRYVASGPMVRSSYKAGEFFMENMIRAKQRESSAASTIPLAALSHATQTA